LANVPGAQKLAPLSSADGEPRPKIVANASTAIRISNLGERRSEAIATTYPSLSGEFRTSTRDLTHELTQSRRVDDGFL
jgi:hypothetical protein